ncbi:MAG: 3-oxoacid CoA-transferase subunit A [Chloroflexi bacterium]|nr:3-oxoacid CoA-transferase subunit A [Chloroflexota bacterium]
MTVSKVWPSAREAVADVFDGAVIMMDGFGGPGGMAQELILALRERGVRDLTIISNTAGLDSVSFGTPGGSLPVNHGILVANGQVRKVIASFPVSASPSRPTSFELLYREGKVELELVPQGTLAERIRAGGAGVAAFYTPTGAGTLVAEGKEVRVLDGREHVLETALKADFACIRAWKADRLGNLVYRGSSRNFNVPMATAARVVIAEVDEVVEPGELDPEVILTPGLYVKRVVVRRHPGKIYTREQGAAS